MPSESPSLVSPDVIIRGRIDLQTEDGAPFTLTPSPPDAMHAELARLSPYFCVLDVKNARGRTMGTASYWLEDDVAYLNWIGIAASLRGQGYATAILQFADEHFRATGVTKLLLKAPGNAFDALHIYEKVGFTATEEEHKTDRWGVLTSMEKRLD